MEVTQHERTPAVEAPLRPLQLAVVLPTFNERANLAPLVERLEAALAGIAWEAIIVDDNSPDGTADEARAISQRDPRIRVIQRIGRRGLASAVIEGMLSTASPVVAVMDADHQHDPRLLPQMLAAVSGGDYDVAVASRFAEGASTEAWGRPDRVKASGVANALARRLTGVELTDPMSGYFMLRTETLRADAHRLSGVGFKILLDLFATSPTPLRFREVPYTFRNRHSGESKLDTNVAWEYVVMLLDRFFGRAVPIRFIAFSLVGVLGLGVHMAALALLLKGLGTGFVAAQAAATLVAMSSNFALNNLLTYRDQRLRGWGLLRGWLSFVAACSIGGLANVGIAAWLFRHEGGWILPAVAGVLVGAVWNYALTALYTWNRPARRRSVQAAPQLTHPAATPPGL